MGSIPTKQELSDAYIGAYLHVCRVEEKFKPIAMAEIQRRQKHMKKSI